MGSGLPMGSGLLIPTNTVFKSYARATKDIQGTANSEVDFSLGE